LQVSISLIKNNSTVGKGKNILYSYPYLLWYSRLWIINKM